MLAGAVIQRYRLHRAPSVEEPYGTPTGPFRQWIAKVTEAMHDQFDPAMRSAGLVFEDAVYAAADIPDTLVVAQIQEFNSLLPKSQEHRVPVYELTPAQLQQVGIVLEASERQIGSLMRIFSDLADRVDALGQANTRA
jgi:hypothetical protein